MSDGWVAMHAVGRAEDRQVTVLTGAAGHPVPGARLLHGLDTSWK